MEQQMQEDSGLAMLVSSLCFAIFGAAAFWYSGPMFSVINIVFGVVVGLIFAFISIRLMAFFIRIANGEMRRQHGHKFALNAVARGMMFMVPFAILAFLAAYVLHWTTATLFISSALMTSGAFAGAELSKLGKPRAINFILPSLIAFLVSAAWMYATGSLQVLLGLVKTLLGA
jgi:heme/copper-type cytochrome/quinol oxidase subunit 2